MTRKLLSLAAIATLSLTAIAGCGGSAKPAGTAPSTTGSPAGRTAAGALATIERRRDELRAIPRISRCRGTYGAIGRCLTRQLDPIVAAVDRLKGAFTAALPGATGPCGVALTRATAFQTGQGSRLRAVATIARTLSNQTQLNRLNAIFATNGKAIAAETAALRRDPSLDWAVSCNPA